MNAKTQLACIWAGPIGIALFAVGFIAVAGMVPPPAPSETASAIQMYYLDNTVSIKIGLVLSMLGGSLTGPFIVAISEQMRRIEGERSPLAWINLAMGTCGVMLFVVPLMLFQAVAFTPLRDPEITQALHDAAWLMLIGAYGPAFVEGIAIAWCCFQDKEERVFPRWLGFANLYVITGFALGSAMYFFKDGPFSYNGIIGFWVVLLSFFAWIIVMFLMVRRAILRTEHELVTSSR